MSRLALIAVVTRKALVALVRRLGLVAVDADLSDQYTILVDTDGESSPTTAYLADSRGVVLQDLRDA